jgi:MYXO-CTERM domain-containing protein
MENQEVPAGKATLGAKASLFERLKLDQTRGSGRYSLPSVSGPIETTVKHLDQGAGWFSMVGRAADSADSDFILKGDERGAYGWLVYRDRGIAYEYTTDDAGNLAVEQVPVTKIFPVCNAPPESEEPAPVAAFAPPSEEDSADTFAAGAWPSHVGMYPGNDLTKLQSRPGVQKVWYINITAVMNGDTPKSGQTKADVWQTWAIMSATLYPFNVNVTTDPAVYEAAGVSNSGCSKMAYVSAGSSSCGLNAFGTRNCCDVHYYNNGYATGRIANHEAGHAYGLLHDGGDNGGEYFNGFSSFQWTPLMGNVWPGDRWAQALFQFSKGEYTSATQKQDDFTVINRHMEFVPDDIPATTPLIFTGTTIDPHVNWGQIHKNTDSDSWSFEIATGGGHATLKIDRIEDKGGSMLDIDASILDSGGKAVAQNNAAVARSASFNVDLPAGSYTLLIKGGSEGTPEKGFSNYSSVGLYSIDGSITGGSSTGGTGGTGGASGTGGMGNAGAAGRGGAAGASSSGGTSGSGGAAGASSKGGAAGAVSTGGAPSGGAGGNSTAGAGAANSGGSSGAAGTTGTAGVISGGGPSGGAIGTGGVTASGGSTATGGSITGGTGGGVGSGGALAGSGGKTNSAGAAGTPPSDPSEPSGCSCTTAGGDPTSSWLSTSLAGLAVALASLRRRQRGRQSRLRHQP